ncbi:transcription antitermination factor NusB [Propionibacteriaceae bacterium Y2011]|uniref:transcription antitermination factor NusB n=1 Tax=Microlunatus sp. Y2014 TaxID=3418488 RepID=UPI003B4D56CB
MPAQPGEPARPDRPTTPIKRSTRGKARKRAVDILFEAELRGTDALTTLADRTADADPPIRDFTTQLVNGVHDNQSAIDAQLSAHLAQGWALARLPRVDRAVLRIAAYEISSGDVPADVAISEAVSLAGELSTDESPAFVNGVLGKLASNRAAGNHSAGIAQ